VAKTQVRCEAGPSQVMLTIDPRQGAYRGMPAKRGYEVWMHMVRPKTVTATGGGKASKTDWSYDAEAKALRLEVTEDSERKAPIVIRCDL